MIIAMISLLALASITTYLFKVSNPQARSSICEGSINIGTAIRDADTPFGTEWVVSSIGRMMVENTLCATVINTIEIKGKSEEEIDRNVAIAIGEMIETCWRQFGEGKKYNVFVQSAFDNVWTNYYFICYRFKLEFPDQFVSYQVPTSALMDVENGLLWTLNTRGKQLSESPAELYAKYVNGDRNSLSYGGYVEWDGYGYLEFVESTESSFIRTPASFSGSMRGWLLPGSAKIIKPASGAQIPAIKSSEFYEVRFFSPIEYTVNFDRIDVITNNIKIMPAYADSAATQLEGVIVNE